MASVLCNNRENVTVRTNNENISLSTNNEIFYDG